MANRKLDFRREGFLAEPGCRIVAVNSRSRVGRSNQARCFFADPLDSDIWPGISRSTPTRERLMPDFYFFNARAPWIRTAVNAAAVLGLALLLSALGGCFMAAGVVVSALDSPQPELVARADFFAGSVKMVVRVLPERSRGGLGPRALVVDVIKGSPAESDVARRGSSGKEKVLIVVCGNAAQEGIIEVMPIEVKSASIAFTATPKLLALAPGQWSSFEPMIYESDKNLDRLDVTLSISVAGVTETQQLTLTKPVHR